MAEGGEPQMAKFIRLAKGDSLTQRLILGKVPVKGQGKLSTTDVIDSIRALRDSAREAMITTLFEEDTRMAGKIDVCIDGDNANSRKRPKTQKPKPNSKVRLPRNFVTIQTEALLPDIPSISMMVLIEPNTDKKNPFFVDVHLSELTLSYLHSAATKQIDKQTVCKDDGATSSAGLPKLVLGMTGLSRVHTGRYAGWYRFNRKGNKGKRRQYWNAATEEEAKRRVLVQRPSCGDGGNHAAASHIEIDMPEEEDVVSDQDE